MARLRSSSSARLRTRLSALAEYLEAVAELRTMLLQSSPSVFISNPEELISLVEVAKTTLQKNGVSLHTFSSCPDYLSAYKAAYFGLLLQLQARSQNARLESRDLLVRLNRLLFPLSTQLRVSTKAGKQDIHGGYATQARNAQQPGTEDCSTETNPAPLFPATSPVDLYLAKYSAAPPPNLPPNIMLPPPAPLRRSRQPLKVDDRFSNLSSDCKLSRSRRGASVPMDKASLLLSKRRGISNDTVHFKRRQGEAIAIHSSKSHGNLSLAENDDVDGRDDSTESSESGSEDDEDSEPSHILVPSHSPLRRSFGIFCTGKGRGAFSGSTAGGQRRIRTQQGGSTVASRRRSKESIMDTDS